MRVVEHGGLLAKIGRLEGLVAVLESGLVLGA